MRRLIWLPVAGFLLIAGATVAAAAPGVVSRVQAVLPAAEASPDANSESGAVLMHDRNGLLTEVLADLVADGTITQAQADAITDGIAQKIEDKKAALDALRQKWQEIIADGVITQAEIDQLPADNPFRLAFDSIAEDGQVTLDQLRQLHPLGRGPGFFGGRGHHGPFDWPAPPDVTEEVPEATPGS